MPMRRGLLHAAAWLLATGAAVTLSWWGVHTVLAGTAYDRPRALTVTADETGNGTGTESAGDPRASSTSRPRPDPDPTSSPPADETPGKSAGTPREPEPRPSAEKPAPETTPATSGQVKSYTAAGGRVVLDLGEASADLVSATPDSGWQMQVWEQSEWIRVDFSSGDRTTSVFCTWNGHPPSVQVVEG